MKTIYYLFAAVILLGASACDQITGTYLETPVINPEDTAKVWRKVFLEDFTGYTCGNCPAAHEVAKQLTDTYKDRVIVLGLHTGSFAEPNISHYYDFRTAEGNTYDAFFGNSQAGHPNGLINRMKFNNSYITRHNKWASLVSGLINQEADVSLKLEASFDESSRKISVGGNMKFLKNVSSNHYICVLISEDSITQYQKDYRKTPQDILDYNHMHVLRGGITSAWGDRISNEVILAKTKFDIKYDYTIPNDKDWKPKNLHIIAYIYAKDKDYEVIQVESVPLIKN